MYDFLSDDNVVSDVSSRDKTSLFLCNDFEKDRLEPVGSDLHHQFIKDSAKTNRTELEKVLRILDFRNKNDQSVIKLRFNTTFIEDLNPLTNSGAHSIPLLLKEESMKTITSRGF